MYSYLLLSPALADGYSFVTDRGGFLDRPLFLILLLVGVVFVIGVMSDR